MCIWRDKTGKETRQERGEQKKEGNDNKARRYEVFGCGVSYSFLLFLFFLPCFAGAHMHTHRLCRLLFYFPLFFLVFISSSFCQQKSINNSKSTSIHTHTYMLSLFSLLPLSYQKSPPPFFPCSLRTHIHIHTPMPHSLSLFFSISSPPHLHKDITTPSPSPANAAFPVTLASPISLSNSLPSPSSSRRYTSFVKKYATSSEAK